MKPKRNRHNVPIHPSMFKILEEKSPLFFPYSIPPMHPRATEGGWGGGEGKRAQTQGQGEIWRGGGDRTLQKGKIKKEELFSGPIFTIWPRN